MTVTYEDLNQFGKMVFLKMQAAWWAAQEKNRVMGTLGLQSEGCPFCGSTNICSKCGRCPEHHESSLAALTPDDVRALSIAGFIASFCQANAYGIMDSIVGITDPHSVTTQYHQGCDGEELNLDPDIWGQFFDDDE